MRQLIYSLTEKSCVLVDKIESLHLEDDAIGFYMDNSEDWLVLVKDKDVASYLKSQGYLDIDMQELLSRLYKRLCEFVNFGAEAEFYPKKHIEDIAADINFENKYGK